MPLFTTQANKTLEAQLGKTAFGTQTVYVGLSSTTPSADGNGVTEPSGGSYARVATSAATWASAASGSITNTAAVTFPAATADWSAGANQTYVVLFDASTAGNKVMFGALTTPKAVLSGDTISFAASSLTISLS